MPTHTLTYHIAAIGPSDTEEDVMAVRNAVNELTKEFVLQDVSLTFHHWKDLAPGLGKSGQTYIDETISWADMDFVVGLLWQRFGTPIEGAMSGTEHEFREIYRLFSARRQPDLLFYFKSAATTENNDDKEQIQTFKKDIQSKALTGKYTSYNELERQVRDDLRKKINAKIASQNQTQRRIGQLPPNRRITVELIIFSEFPEQEVMIPVIILLKNFQGEEFVFDTRTMYPQELANWIAKSMGFAVTSGRTLRSFLDSTNQRNYKMASDAGENPDEEGPVTEKPFGLEPVDDTEALKKSSMIITQLWLGNILYADHPSLRLKELKIALGAVATKAKMKEDAIKNGGSVSVSLPRPQIQNGSDGKRLVL